MIAALPSRCYSGHGYSKEAEEDGNQRMPGKDVQKKCTL